MLSAAAGHVRQMIKEKNFEPGNAVPVFFYDVLVPLAHLALLGMRALAERGRRTR